MDRNGVEIVKTGENAEHLGRFFALVENLSFSCTMYSAVINASPVLEYILFPVALVKREPKILKQAKPSGPEDKPAKLLSELVVDLSKPLAHIFNLTFGSGWMPSNCLHRHLEVSTFSDSKRCPERIRLRHALQEDLNRLSNWSARWLLHFNVGKCVILRLCTIWTIEEDDSYQYLLDGQSLSIVEEQNDLGVLINFSIHPSSQCLKAA
ncbi:unnamed protein product [Schistocephalus solidus]|uniref:DUF4283 domain-containing protein n=1 Tax=Schistocephalus solidus TaxID=70667 RepID=A0A183TUM9_SCHSO|nr:unnamed protein product [Schistocephalus solidus]